MRHFSILQYNGNIFHVSNVGGFYTFAFLLEENIRTAGISIFFSFYRARALPGVVFVVLMVGGVSQVVGSAGLTKFSFRGVQTCVRPPREAWHKQEPSVQGPQTW